MIPEDLDAKIKLSRSEVSPHLQSFILGDPAR